MRCILAIDPGTRCGWAVRHDDGGLSSGTWNLQPRRDEGAGMRWIKLRRFLDDVAEAGPPKLVAFEEVHAHTGTHAAHIYGGIIAHVQAWCEGRSIPYTGIPVGTVKKRATGKGNAAKDEVVKAASLKWPGQLVSDDNQADALWILDEAIAQYG